MRHTRYQGAIVRDDSILLIRHLSQNTGNRYWVVPGGGIEANESEIACVEREMREETGLRVRVERVLVDAREKNGRFYRRQKTFLCTPVGGTAAPGVEPEDEAANFAITDVRWFDLADPASWFEYIAAEEWVVPLLWEIRGALGYTGAVPAGVERLDVQPLDSGDLSTAGQSVTPSASSPTAGSPRVRVARATDLPAARRILRAARESLVQSAITEWPEGDSGEIALAEDIRAGNLHIGEIDGSPVGIASATEEYRPEHREVRWRCTGTALCVHRLAVWPENRRQGIASHLLRRLEHRACSLRYSAIRMDACTSNAPAIALCESRGYHRVGMVHYAAADFVCFERSCLKPPKE